MKIMVHPSKVYVDGNDYSELGDMVAAFVSGEQRGVGLAEEVHSFSRRESHSYDGL